MGGKGEFRWRLSMLVGKRGVVCEVLCLNSRGGRLLPPTNFLFLMTYDKL